MRRVRINFAVPVILPLIVAILTGSIVLSATEIPVRHREGLVHGFLVLRNLNNEVLADGDLIQNERGDHVTTQLLFHFKDGSFYHETAVFSQHRYFRLMSDHLVLKGPTFKRSIDLKVDAVAGNATVKYSEDGKEKTAKEDLHNQLDLANGLILILLKNIHPDATPIKVAMVVPTPKPKLIKLSVSAQAKEPFVTGDARRTAIHYVAKVELTGVTGVLASLLGKEPPDTNVWILDGDAPAFVKFEGPLEAGGPVWRIELVSPTW